jgi:hypothetical protein
MLDFSVIYPLMSFARILNNFKFALTALTTLNYFSANFL